MQTISNQIVVNRATLWKQKFCIHTHSNGSLVSPVVASYLALAELPNINDSTIKRDLNRTFPEDPVFRTLEGRNKLFRVLRAIANLDGDELPHVGYCQGLNFVVGLFLTHLEEKEAFEACLSLMIRFKLKGLYEAGFPLLAPVVSYFEQLLALLLPDLSSLLWDPPCGSEDGFDDQDNDYEDVHATEPIRSSYFFTVWLLSLYADSLPRDHCLALWDLFSDYPSALPPLIAAGLIILDNTQHHTRNLTYDQLLVAVRGLPALISLSPDDFVTQVRILCDTVCHPSLVNLWAVTAQTPPRSSPHLFFEVTSMENHAAGDTPLSLSSASVTGDFNAPSSSVLHDNNNNNLASMFHHLSNNFSSGRGPSVDGRILAAPPALPFSKLEELKRNHALIPSFFSQQHQSLPLPLQMAPPPLPLNNNNSNSSFVFNRNSSDANLQSSQQHIPTTAVQQLGVLSLPDPLPTSISWPSMAPAQAPYFNSASVASSSVPHHTVARSCLVSVRASRQPASRSVALSRTNLLAKEPSWFSLRTNSTPPANLGAPPSLRAKELLDHEFIFHIPVHKAIQSSLLSAFLGLPRSGVAVHDSQRSFGTVDDFLMSSGIVEDANVFELDERTPSCTRSQRRVVNLETDSHLNNITSDTISNAQRRLPLLRTEGGGSHIEDTAGENYRSSAILVGSREPLAVMSRRTSNASEESFVCDLGAAPTSVTCLPRLCGASSVDVVGEVGIGGGSRVDKRGEETERRLATSSCSVDSHAVLPSHTASNGSLVNIPSTSQLNSQPHATSTRSMARRMSAHAEDESNETALSAAPRLNWSPPQPESPSKPPHPNLKVGEKVQHFTAEINNSYKVVFTVCERVCENVDIEMSIRKLMMDRKSEILKREKTNFSGGLIFDAIPTASVAAPVLKMNFIP